MGCTLSYMLDASIINEPKVQNKPKLGNLKLNVKAVPYSQVPMSHHKKLRTMKA
jgi:hypothetical protein